LTATIIWSKRTNVLVCKCSDCKFATYAT